jgi:hypothetical protein
MVLPICSPIRPRSAAVKPVASPGRGVPNAKATPYSVLGTVTGKAGRPNLRLSSRASSPSMIVSGGAMVTSRDSKSMTAAAASRS